MTRSPFPALALVWLVGCDGGPALVPVSGTVSFPDGKPVKGGVVEFAPVGGGPGARGPIDANGRFTLTTGDKPGAVVGPHKVVVIPAVLADGAAAHVGAHHAALVVHPKFASYESSGLTVTVGPKGDDAVTLRVEPAAAAKKGW